MNRLIVFFIAMVLFCTNVAAQNGLPVNANTGKVTFMEVVEAKNLKAEELYKFLSDWLISKGYVSTKKDDAGYEGTFSGNFILEYPSIKNGRNDKGKVNYIFQIFGKDGKYRYIITDFVHEGLEGAGNGGKIENVQPECGKEKMVPGNWVLIKNKTKSHIESTLAELKKAELAFRNDPSKNKDW